MSLKKILTNFRLGPFILLFYMKIQITKNSDVREEKKNFRQWTPKPPKRQTHFWSGSTKKNFLNFCFQQGSVQKFWKFARLLNVIWAFRKKAFQVDQRESIFLNLLVSQTVPLKHFNFLNKMVNLDLTLQKKALFSFNRALTGLKVVTEKIIWVSTQIGCSRAGLQPSVNETRLI